MAISNEKNFEKRNGHTTSSSPKKYNHWTQRLTKNFQPIKDNAKTELMLGTAALVLVLAAFMHSFLG